MKKNAFTMSERFRLLREAAYNDGLKEFSDLEKRPGFTDFICVYCCEGYRKNRNEASVVNSDLAVMKISFYWFKEFAKNKIFFELQIYADHDEENVKNYWVNNLGIKDEEIRVRLKVGGNRRKAKLKFGTIAIKTCDTYFRAKLEAWMSVIKTRWTSL